MSCNCSRTSRSIYCKDHGDTQYLRSEPKVTKSDKKFTKSDTSDKV